MTKNNTQKVKRQFLIKWSVFNFAGLILGIFFVFLILYNLEYSDKFSTWRTFCVWLPLGGSVGFFQWLKLKQFGINFAAWVIFTALGFSFLFALYAWILNFDYIEYNIPYWLIYLGLGFAVFVGGAIIGSFQSIVIRKHVSSVRTWIKAYIYSSLLALVIGIIAFSFKSIFLNILYFFGLYFIAFGLVKYILLYTLLLLVTSISIACYTGKVLLEQLSLSPDQRTA